MLTYLVLGRYTQPGAFAINNLPTADMATAHFQQAGIVLKSLYLTLGQYDLVASIEVPDEQTLMRLIVQIATQGLLSTQTLRAFTVDEFGEVAATAYSNT